MGAFTNMMCCQVAVPQNVASSPMGSPSVEGAASAQRAIPPRPVVYPLRASANQRYLVDQNNQPFLMVGDSPQTMVANLALPEAAAYMANREQYGINTLWINLLCNFSDSCNKDARTVDGKPPFLAAGDLSKPNPAYFDRVDDIIRLAATHGMLVLLDPIETTSWLPILRAAGVEQAFGYGQYLGHRYKDFPNIIWMHGNDFQTWHDVTDDSLLQAVARGIRSEDQTHIHTIELNYLTSGSLDDPTWAQLVDLDAAYTYFPTFAQVLAEYNRAAFKPVFMVEANYEFERDVEGLPRNLRRQEYWTMLSGAAGQVYGSAYTWQLAKDWESKIDTPGVVQLHFMKNLFVERKWYELVPDQDHSVVVAGYDLLSELLGKLVVYARTLQLPFDLVTRLTRHAPLASVSTNTFASAARAADGTLVMVYLPSIRTLTIDMSKLAGSATARWYDPTTGQYSEIEGSPFSNVELRQFRPPGNNATDDGDWVLILEVGRPSLH
jgi:hypothetical protein